MTVHLVKIHHISMASLNTFQMTWVIIMVNLESFLLLILLFCLRMGRKGRYTIIPKIVDRYAICTGTTINRRMLITTFSQKRMTIGKAYHIKEIVKGRYYYPRAPGMYTYLKEAPRLASLVDISVVL